MTTVSIYFDWDHQLCTIILLKPTLKATKSELVDVKTCWVTFCGPIAHLEVRTSITDDPKKLPSTFYRVLPV